MFCAAWAVTAQAQTLTDLNDFTGVNGSTPLATMIQASDGNLYGTTSTGGTQSGGTIYRYLPAASTFETLYNFCAQANCPDGSNPGSLVQGLDLNLYGTTQGGGAHANGTVFQLTLGGAVTTLYSFCAQTNCPDGSSPNGGLVQGSDGNFYGTTTGGGTNSQGTVFKITPQGTLTTLYSFCAQSDCPDGQTPNGGLVQGVDGNFYGTTPEGAVGGTVFKITPAGAFTTLYIFCTQTNCPDGVNPKGGLVQGTDGNFYGTTFGGGTTDSGTVFEITPSGTLTTLYSFCDCGDGNDPSAALIQASDGRFYGTAFGGAFGRGAVYAISSNPEATVYSFCQNGGDCADGAKPLGGLLQGTDGNLYGTTSLGGADDDGIAFSLNLPLIGMPSFTVSAAPGTLSVGQNGSGATTVTVTPVAFNGIVTFSASGLPSGVTASFSPANTRSTSALTLTASATATTGPATVTVTGTSGSLMEDGTINLMVTPPVPQYSLAAGAPTQSTISPGGSSQSTVTVTSTNGYTGTVTLSCSIVPAVTPPPTCSFGSTSPVTVTTNGGSATLTFTASGSSAAMMRAVMRSSGTFYAWWLPMSGLALIGAGWASPRRRRSRLFGLMVLAMVLACLLGLPGCGGSSNGTGGGGGTPAGAYTVTITGTDGSGASQSNAAPTVVVNVS